MDPETREEMYLNSILTGAEAPDPPKTREEWYLSKIAEGIGDLTQPFTVHLTPTAQDFSGVMDKTCAEITAAYEAGKEIWFDVDATALGYDLWRVKATIVAKVANSDYGQAMAFLINIKTSPATLIFIFTNFSDDGSEQSYHTRIYPLTSA